MCLREILICILLCLVSFCRGVFAAEFEAPAVSGAVSSFEETGTNWMSGWYIGAEGYAKAIEEYERTDKAMAVYIDVKWCPYCRLFEKNVLSTPEVREFMNDMIRVRIDPETGTRENSIAFQYGVMGFPSFYVHPPQQGGAVRLYTGIPPGQFIELFKKALG
ncbi:MAG: Thiol:disulfide interchange protein DsbD [Candidatus Omnitrophica bacterium ADurb.Bin277]|nr:MAG: Thiol:disulfide interchange protein DsbD [Candidatus Omnitrophica bacterium ADurb.Bin277]